MASGTSSTWPKELGSFHKFYKGTIIDDKEIESLEDATMEYHFASE